MNKEASKKEIKAAKKFLDYMNCSEDGKKNTVENFMFIPAYQGYEDYTSDVNLIKEYTKYVNEDTYRQSVFNATNVDWLKNSIGTGIQEYITDDASWDEVVSDVKGAWKPAEEK